MIRALTKRRPDGAPYDRDPVVTAAIQALAGLSGNELVARCAIGDPVNPDYVASEAVVYFLRDTRWDNNDARFQQLYLSIMRRLLRALPRAERTRDGKVEVDLTLSDIRDAVRDRFQEILVMDRAGGDERLDYFEIRFDAAVARLRSTARRKAWKESNRQEALEIDAESGEPSLTVERAAGSLDVAFPLYSDDPAYRSKVLLAIDALPDLQRRIMHMLMQGFQIDSQNPDLVTIRKAVGKSEKTVRLQRDAAIEAIKAALGLETDQ